MFDRFITTLVEYVVFLHYNFVCFENQSLIGVLGFIILFNLFSVSVCSLPPTVRVADLNFLELVLYFSDFALNFILDHPYFVGPYELFNLIVFLMALLFI